MLRQCVKFVIMAGIVWQTVAISQEKEAENLNHQLGRLLRPGMGLYFVVMALFCVAALVTGQYWLAAAESAMTLLVFAVYMVN